MVRRASLLAAPVIGGLVLMVYLACIGLGGVLGWPWDLGLPWTVRLVGLLPLAYGLAMIAWVFRSRGPAAVLESTWLTFLKLLRFLPLEISAGRTEPLVVSGPYRLVRHPLYSGVDGMAFGIAVLVDHPWAYLGALVLGLWFAIVLAPFEERELSALFGDAYAAYARTHHRFLPRLWSRY